MRDMRRRQKKLERQRKKREERRADLQRRGSYDRLLVDAPEAYVTSVSAEPWPADVASWPVVRAYAPVLDVWRASGLGLAGVVRQRPTGGYVCAFFMLELHDHGLKGTFGKDVETLAEVDDLLADMADEFHPLELGPVELAAEFAWGARALARAHGLAFPAEIDRFFALMPRPAGKPRDWQDRLTGPRGVTPAGLVRVLRENPLPHDLPDGKEVMLLTEATFSLDDGPKAVAALRGASREFAHEGRDDAGDRFTWTSAPSSRWNPLDLFGGRQVDGTVRVAEGRLVAEAQTLSMTAKLIARLRATIGAGLRLDDCRWTGQRELRLAAARRG